MADCENINCSQKITSLVANIQNALQLSLAVTKHESLITLRTVFLMSTVLHKPEMLPFSLQQFQDIDFNINAGNIQMCLHHEFDCACLPPDLSPADITWRHTSTCRNRLKLATFCLT